MIYVFLADGFEEIEALAPVDFLRRAGINTITVGVTGDVVLGAHNIAVKADVPLSEAVLSEELDGIILPGGMPGAENLDNCSEVQSAIEYCAQNGKIISAICAAPFILGKKGLLNGKRATCFPGFEEYLEGATVTGEGVVKDGRIITAKGAGVAWEFGAEIAALLVGEEKSKSILGAIQWKK
ncbi:MAG: DJ-1/PfpI family protein [Clostridia bacterium]|nr:DJ-1/PfpI family protein [Clostridia bacterium]